MAKYKNSTMSRETEIAMRVKKVFETSSVARDLKAVMNASAMPAALLQLSTLAFLANNECAKGRLYKYPTKRNCFDNTSGPLWSRAVIFRPGACHYDILAFNRFVFLAVVKIIS